MLKKLLSLTNTKGGNWFVERGKRFKKYITHHISDNKEKPYTWNPRKYRYKSPFAKHNHDILPDIEEDMSKSELDESTKEVLKEVFKPRKSIEELIRMSVYDQMKVILG
jgi:hypothetical protein